MPLRTHNFTVFGGSENTQIVIDISGHPVTLGLIIGHLISIRVHLQPRNCLSKEEWFIENDIVLQESTGDYTIIPLSGIFRLHSASYVSWTLRAPLNILCH